MAGIHPLDRVPELAPARVDRAGDDRHQRPGHRLPPVMEGRLGWRVRHRPETLHATQIMDAVHEPDSTAAAASVAAAKRLRWALAAASIG